MMERMVPKRAMTEIHRTYSERSLSVSTGKHSEPSNGSTHVPRAVNLRCTNWHQLDMQVSLRRLDPCSSPRNKKPDATWSESGSPSPSRLARSEDRDRLSDSIEIA
jgi:hypothetical protein